MKSLITFLCIAITTSFIFSSFVYRNITLQQGIGMTNEQLKYTSNLLAEHNITYKTINVSDNPVVVGMDADWKAYDLICNDETSYILILRKTDNDFTALLDNKGIIIEGLIDNGVTPSLFKDGRYIFEDYVKHSLPVIE